jgi:hypothetical protein
MVSLLSFSRIKAGFMKRMAFTIAFSLALAASGGPLTRQSQTGQARSGTGQARGISSQAGRPLCSDGSLGRYPKGQCLF